MLIAEQENLPGRGHMAFDREPRPPSIPNFDVGKINFCLSTEGRAMSNIGFTTQEFSFFLIRYTEMATQAQFRPGKGDFRGQLFFYLHFNKANSTMREMEASFYLAKSAINRSLPRIAGVLIDVCKDILVNLFPNRAERDFMRTFLPALLRDTGLFFNVDSSKILGSDSLQLEVAGRHFNRFKGMGLTLIVITDIFGHVIYMEVMDGNGADVHTISPNRLLQTDGSSSYF